MNRTEMRELSHQLQTLPNFVLRMLSDHPNQTAELAANELIVRSVRSVKERVLHSQA
ncbi:MAG TPA: hypothetical protein VGE97_09440 [Nitrososphaera sp.]|jgi:hypothetical protein